LRISFFSSMRTSSLRGKIARIYKTLRSVFIIRRESFRNWFHVAYGKKKVLSSASDGEILFSRVTHSGTLSQVMQQQSQNSSPAGRPPAPHDKDRAALPGGTRPYGWAPCLDFHRDKRLLFYRLSPPVRACFLGLKPDRFCISYERVMSLAFCRGAAVTPPPAAVPFLGGGRCMMKGRRHV
jgi:hypothetical protein